MTEERMKKLSEGQTVEDDGVSFNSLVHQPGISMQESTRLYNQWTSYEQDLNPERYRGPVIAAQAVADFFQKNREQKLVIDIACGTGFVAQELKKLGFQRFHGLEASSNMLATARQKNLYEKEFLCYLDHNPLPIQNDMYDCAVTSGGMGEGHIPTGGLHQLARIVKPGGLVCIVMREEYLENVEDYKGGQLETTMEEMETAGMWKMASRVIVPRYSYNNNGVVFKFIVC